LELIYLSIVAVTPAEFCISDAVRDALDIRYKLPPPLVVKVLLTVTLAVAGKVSRLPATVIL
jgi:hypothetical protein